MESKGFKDTSDAPNFSLGTDDDITHMDAKVDVFYYLSAPN